MAQVPSWLKNYIDEDGVKRIEIAVQEAEKKTSGEIVPMIVRSSSTVGHVPILLTVAFVALFFGLDVYNIQLEYFAFPEWIMICINIVLLVILVRVLSPLGLVERLLTPKQDQQAQVEQRALNEFYNHRVHHTENATGVLIYVSLMERKAVVLGDDPIADKMPPERWGEVVGNLLNGLKVRDAASGYEGAIALAGSELQKNFPIQTDDADEIKNHLIIKE